MQVRLLKSFIAFLACVFALLGQFAHAQARLPNAQIDQLLAPVALYPDALLSQVLMASTYPDNVADAAKWSAAHASLSGDAATRAVESESWDPSVKSLAAFPSVLDMMGRQPQWVQSVGDAFLAQPDDVMASIQRLRLQARQAGSLDSNDKQKVITETVSTGQTVVKIEPASPQVVYVPVYNPATVYGTWAYPSYPPYYYPAPPGSAFARTIVSGISFGLGVAAIDSLWGDFNWRRGDVDINVHHYNNINVHHRLDGNNNTWHHNPEHRGHAPYRNDAVRNRYDNQRVAGLANKATVLPARDATRDRAAQSFERSTGQPIAGRGNAAAARTSPGQRSGGDARATNRPAMAEQQRTAQVRTSERAQTTNRNAAATRNNSGQRADADARSTNRTTVVERQRTDQVKARERAQTANRSSALQGVNKNRQVNQKVQQRGATAQTHANRPNRGDRAGGGARQALGGR